jgi:hypothetical protein
MGAPRALSEHLLSLDTFPSFRDATRHTFLTQAGNGTLPLSRLALWLSQDRIYAAHAYPRFIGSLISCIPFHDADSPSGPKERQNEEILQMLVKCLDNIVREVQFFKETTEKYGLNVEEWAQRKATRDYTAEMVRVASLGSLQDGLIFLWAMERVRLILFLLFVIILDPSIFIRYISRHGDMSKTCKVNLQTHKGTNFPSSAPSKVYHITGALPNSKIS